METEVCDLGVIFKGWTMPDWWGTLKGLAEQKYISYMARKHKKEKSIERQMVEGQRQIWTISELPHGKLNTQERERKVLFLLFFIPSN